MSIDAKITHVAPAEDGGWDLWLARRQGATTAGQHRMHVDPPVTVRPQEGWEIWGGDSSIMLGDKRLYRRDGYTGARECETTAEAVRMYAPPAQPEAPANE